MKSLITICALLSIIVLIAWGLGEVLEVLG